MKIGLIRHFRVRHKTPKKFLLSVNDLIKWFDEYELADVDYGTIDLGVVEWHRCYTSPLNRALKTANHLFKGQIVAADALKELNIVPALQSKLKLPLLMWALWVRHKTLSRNKSSVGYQTAIALFLDEIILNHPENILIVGHVFSMKFIRNELMRRGFNGPAFGTPENGMVYIFENNSE